MSGYQQIENLWMILLPGGRIHGPRFFENLEYARWLVRHCPEGSRVVKLTEVSYEYDDG